MFLLDVFIRSLLDIFNRELFGGIVSILGFFGKLSGGIVFFFGEGGFFDFSFLGVG